MHFEPLHSIVESVVFAEGVSPPRFVSLLVLKRRNRKGDSVG